MNTRKMSILVSMKFIENPDEILERSLEVAKKYDAKIYIIHVIEDMPKLSFYSDAYRLWEEFRDQAVKSTLQEMTKYIHTLSKDFSDIEPIIDVGSPCEKVIEQADKLDVDLIIVGRHSRSGVSQLMHKNVGNKIIRMARRPVLSFYIES